MEKNVNAKYYCEVLGEHFLHHYPNQRFKFLHDNARAHISKYTKNWLHDKGVSVIPDFPPYSPDFNIIELILQL